MFKHIRFLEVVVIASALAAVAGCYSPGGGMFHSAGGPITYLSTERLQKTIEVIDLRSQEVVFTYYVPPGKQPVIDFDEGEGDDPVHTPAYMRYELMDAGTSTGKLGSSLTVPPAASRRIDVRVHRGFKYAEAPPDRQLRTDELIDRPDWWTPRGGDLPRDRGTGMYDE